MPRKIILVLVSIMIHGLLSGQDQGYIKGTTSKLFAIDHNGESIRFILSGADLSQKKPLLLFLQGSLPRPLFIELEDGYKHLSNYNFDYTQLAKDYHLLMISMPHTPVVVSVKRLNPQMCYVPDPAQPDQFDPQYIQANYMETYVRRGNAVLDYVLAQTWADPSKCLVVGHSQGAKIAVKMARSNPSITHMAFLSGNPEGRFEGFVRKIRSAEQCGQMTSAAAQEEINRLYKEWQEICKNPTQDINIQGDSFRATATFSERLTDDLLLLNIPIYVAYGTRDLGAQTCDMLPLEFIRARKHNLRFVPYPGLGHNFEVVDSEGKSHFNQMHWQEVMDALLVWVEEN